MCYFHALQKGDVNKVVPIDKSSTILTILLALIFLQEGLSLGKGVGIVLIGVGTMLMITRKGMANQEKSSDGSWFIYAVFSAVFASLTAILGKAGIEVVVSNLCRAIRTTVVLVMAWGMVFLTNAQGGIPAISTKSWLFLILSGLATGASWLCYYKALQLGEVCKVVPVDKMSVVFTLVLAFVFLHEKFTPKSLIGCVLIGAGTLLMVL